MKQQLARVESAQKSARRSVLNLETQLQHDRLEYEQREFDLNKKRKIVEQEKQLSQFLFGLEDLGSKTNNLPLKPVILLW